MEDQVSGVTQIFVDGNCVICDWEISHYKRMAPELFEIVDISNPAFDAKKFGLTAEAVNAKMHVRTPEGDLKIGVEAFAHVWDRLERFRLASKLIRNPLIRPIAEVGYQAFAAVRPWLPKKNRRS